MDDMHPEGIGRLENEEESLKNTQVLQHLTFIDKIWQFVDEDFSCP